MIKELGCTDLEHSGGRQQLANGDLGDPDVARVHEVEQARHGGGTHALELHP